VDKENILARRNCLQTLAISTNKKTRNRRKNKTKFLAKKI